MKYEKPRNKYISIECPRYSPTRLLVFKNTPSKSLIYQGFQRVVFEFSGFFVKLRILGKKKPLYSDE